MTRTADFSLRNSYAAQKQMAQLGFALLRMQADTPAGEWVDERFGAEYREVWKRARSLAGDDAAEDLFLTLLTGFHFVNLVCLLTGGALSFFVERLLRLREEHAE